MRWLVLLPAALLPGLLAFVPLLGDRRSVVVELVGIVLLMAWIMVVEWRILLLAQTTRELQDGVTLNAMGSAFAVSSMLPAMLQKAFTKLNSEQQDQRDDDTGPAEDPNHLWCAECEREVESLLDYSPSCSGLSTAPFGRCVGCNESVRVCARNQGWSLGTCCDLCVCRERLAAADRSPCEEGPSAS